ncbi:hypothetical protein H8F21_18730 [Pseudomonas sp. P66]|uniref:Uncharacterized protein n=1 Tax=Pseudomonas arcuscaelestis TaxID=2710591 RepID=A0ABS2C1P9_9PSED|nr:hypothetical protein [Pseudomonas arcuscaelestis]MBM5459605.1 hypothetical protein [Pseudomonas arcuscaelestis]
MAQIVEEWRAAQGLPGFKD